MDQTTMDPAQAQRIVATAMPILLLIGLLFYAVLIVPLWVAFKKTGRPGALSLLTLIPVIGFLLALYILAFAPWKVVPAPEYGAYPPQFPPPAGYPPVQPYGTSAVAPPAAGYAAPGAYAPAQPGYPPPPEPPTTL